MTDSELIAELTREFSAISAELLCMGVVVKHHDALPRLLAIAKRAVALEAENARLREALDRIADPVKYLRIEAAAEGGRIDGVMANLYMGNANVFRKIAEDALAMPKDGTLDGQTHGKGGGE